MALLHLSSEAFLFCMQLRGPSSDGKHLSAAPLNCDMAFFQDLYPIYRRHILCGPASLELGAEYHCHDQCHSSNDNLLGCAIQIPLLQGKLAELIRTLKLIY